MRNMMSSSKLTRVNQIPPKKELWVGSIFRLYDVHRLDVREKLEDYYDLMLVDLNPYQKDTFALINVTINSDNRGKVFAQINEVYTRFYILSESVQNYFDVDMQLYYIEDWESVILHNAD